MLTAVIGASAVLSVSVRAYEAYKRKDDDLERHCSAVIVGGMESSCRSTRTSIKD